MLDKLGGVFVSTTVIDIQELKIVSIFIFGEEVHQLMIRHVK